jgi:hypothetical protein
MNPRGSRSKTLRSGINFLAKWLTVRISDQWFTFVPHVYEMRMAPCIVEGGWLHKVMWPGSMAGRQSLRVPLCSSLHYSHSVLTPSDSRWPHCCVLLPFHFSIEFSIVEWPLKLGKTYVWLASGRDGAVCIATRYGLDGPGIESRQGRDFPHLSRPGLGHTQYLIQWVPTSRGVALTTRPI